MSTESPSTPRPGAVPPVRRGVDDEPLSSGAPAITPVPTQNDESTVDTEPITEVTLNPGLDPAFGDPVRAARTFVQLAQLATEDLANAGSDFERQRVQAQELVASAVACLVRAQAERALGTYACDGEQRDRRLLSFAWLKRVRSSARGEPAVDFISLARRLEIIALALRLIREADLTWANPLADELQNINDQLDHAEGN